MFTMLVGVVTGMKVNHTGTAICASTRRPIFSQMSIATRSLCVGFPLQMREMIKYSIPLSLPFFSICPVFGKPSAVTGETQFGSDSHNHHMGRPLHTKTGHFSCL